MKVAIPTTPSLLILPCQTKPLCLHYSVLPTMIDSSMLYKQGATLTLMSKIVSLIRYEIKYTDSQLLLVLRYRIEPMDFYPIPARKLGDRISELYKDNSNSEINAELDNGKPTCLNKAAFDIKSVERFCGHVRVEASQTSVLGVRAFNTAQAIELTHSPLRPFGLGSIQNQLIAAKRPFINTSGGVGHPPYLRLSMGDKSQRHYREVNVLYWSMALLDLVYNYIDQCIANAQYPPPFEIPQLRFVEAGLLFVYADRPDTPKVSGGSRPTAIGHTYLAEEVINSRFFKYIHNGSASPRQLTDSEANEIARFLSFTQHVQYTKTGGQVYMYIRLPR